jgi:hypothetical protein
VGAQAVEQWKRRRWPRIKKSRLGSGIISVFFALSPARFTCKTGHWPKRLRFLLYAGDSRIHRIHIRSEVLTICP